MLAVLAVLAVLAKVECRLNCLMTAGSFLEHYSHLFTRPSHLLLSLTSLHHLTSSGVAIRTRITTILHVAPTFLSHLVMSVLFITFYYLFRHIFHIFSECLLGYGNSSPLLNSSSDLCFFPNPLFTPQAKQHLMETFPSIGYSIFTNSTETNSDPFESSGVDTPRPRRTK